MSKKPVRASTIHARAKRLGLAALGGFDVLWARQGFACAICGRQPKPGGRRFAVDHNHRLAKKSPKESVRGALCMFCNRGLRWFMDDPIRLEIAAIYLQEGYLAACKERDSVVR